MPPESPSAAWPDCGAGQVRVLLLGVVHLHNPGADEYDLHVDDVLAPERQSELERLADRLAEWEPDRIATEAAYDDQGALHRDYEAYRRSGAPDHLDERHEVVQVGFRLADRLDHDEVYGVDDPPSDSSHETDDVDALADRGFEPADKSGVTLPDFDARVRDMQERLSSSSLPAFLRYLNRESQLRLNHQGLFGRYLRWGERDNYGGPDTLADWYARNIRVVHNLWRVLDPGDERALLLFGSGHVRVLRHLLDEAPMFCPVSPLPYLEPS